MPESTPSPVESTEHALHRARAAIEARERELSLIYSSVADVIFSIDSLPNNQFRFNSVNRAFLAATALTESQVIGRLVPEVIPEPAGTRVLDACNRACGRKQTVRWEEAAFHASGNKQGEVTITPVVDDAGHCAKLIGTIHDVTERRRADELRFRLAAVVESSDDAIISKTLQGIISTWNEGAQRMFGFAAAEVVGKPITILIPPDRQHEEPRILERIARGERIEHYETVRMRKDGTLLHVSLTVSPMKDDSGKVIGISKIARDITERVRADQALREESLSKDEFLATLSHELRTPLNAILGWAEVLRGNSDPVDLEEGIEVIDRNAHMQAQLIEDLLDMSRIISGKLRLEVQRADLHEVVKAAIATVRHAADAKGIRLQVVLDPQAGPVRGDPNRLQQCVWNLLSNAIKFTPRGGRIEVTLRRINSQLQVCVSDNGIGIDPSFLPHVFERFRQSDSSTTRRHGGLGLGLAIVKSLVELHGGSVHASSAGEGKGSTFCVDLPVLTVYPPEEPDARHATAAAPSPDHPLLAGVTVLAVDDEPDARQLLRRILEAQGARVLLAASADEGFELVRKERPDLILSDIGMPVRDGYDLIRRVRSLPPDGGGRTPAAALTAFARAEDRTRTLRSGYQIHVSKPVSSAELTAVVASLVGRQVFQYPLDSH